MQEKVDERIKYEIEKAVLKFILYSNSIKNYNWQMKLSNNYNNKMNNIEN